MKEKLRRLKTLSGPFSNFELEDLPNDPHTLFITWLDKAIEEGIKEPHAMTLSTIGKDGFPDSRVLILKNIDDIGWYFATSNESVKGQQLHQCPHVALNFYWAPLGRQVRIRGEVMDMGRKQSESDFLERDEVARAVALVGKQSKVLQGVEILETEIDEQLTLLKEQPKLVYKEWSLFAVKATEVEFWQADKDRKHTRVRYYFEGSNWNKVLLYP